MTGPPFKEPLRVRVSGPLACFSRPELKVERVSYHVMTPSAARGVLEAILWKPAIRWHVRRIWVLQPISWTSFRRNEVGSRMSLASTLIVDDDRQQRHTLALRDVDYVIEAEFEFTDRQGSEDTSTKFVEMFQRRVEKGQCFHRPYLGCREFAADFAPAPEAPEVTLDLRGTTTDLGQMLLDIDYRPEPPHIPRFFHAELRSGVLVEAGQDSLPRMAGGGDS
jgi:CRISPR-associated protein Cas5d